MQGTERRRHPRVSAKETVGYMRGVEGSLGEPLRIENLSLGGLFARCEAPLQPGAPVIMELCHPALLNPLKLLGGVVSARGMLDALSAGGLPGMSIRFDPLPSETRARLQTFLEALRVRSAREQEDGRSAFDFAPPSFHAVPGEPAPPPEKSKLTIRRGVLRKPVKRAVRRAEAHNVAAAASAGMSGPTAQPEESVAWPIAASPEADLLAVISQPVALHPAVEEPVAEDLPAEDLAVEDLPIEALPPAAPPVAAAQDDSPWALIDPIPAAVPPPSPAPTAVSAVGAALASMLPLATHGLVPGAGEKRHVAGEIARLRVQMLGLIAELDESRGELSRRTRELEETRAELERARAALMDRDRRLMDLARPQRGAGAH